MKNYKQNIINLIHSYNNLANNYDDDTDTFFHKVTHHVTLKHISDFLSNNRISNILDAGGGTGYWSIVLSKLGYNVILNDISIESLLVASNKLLKESINIPITNSNAEKTCYKSESFDLVFAEGGVISYTPNPDIMLKEMYRIIKPDGYLWIDFMNIFGMACEQQDLKMKFNIAEKDEMLIQMTDWDYPARLFSPDKMISYLNSNNFIVLKQFGSATLINSLNHDKKYSKEYDDESINKIHKIELKFSTDARFIGFANKCQLLCKKSLSG